MQKEILKYLLIGLLLYFLLSKIWNKISNLFNFDLPFSSGTDETRENEFNINKGKHPKSKIFENAIQELINQYEKEGIKATHPKQDYKEFAIELYKDFQDWFISERQYKRLPNFINNEVDFLILEKEFGIQINKDGEAMPLISFFNQMLKKSTVIDLSNKLKQKQFNIIKFFNLRTAKIKEVLQREKIPYPDWANNIKL